MTETPGFFALENLETVLATLVALSIQYPIITGLVVIFLLVTAAEQVEFAYSYTRDRLREGRKGRLVLGGVCLALLAITVLIVSLLRNSATGQPEILTPRDSSTEFFQSVTFSWSLPGVQRELTQRFELQLTDGERSSSFIAPQESYQIKLRDAGYDEGDFRWRVRALSPQRSRWSGWQAFSYYRDHISRINKTGLLRIGVLADEAHPIIYTDLDPANPEGLAGIDIAVAKAIVEQLRAGAALRSDLKIQWVRGVWLDGLVHDLHSKATDFVIANTGIVAARERKHGIRFSEPYMHIKLALLWVDGRFDEDFSSLSAASFQGKSVVAWSGSIAEQFVTAFGGTPLSQPANVDNYTFNQLLRGQADAILEDEYISYCHAADPANADYQLRREVLEIAPPDLSFAYPSPIGAFASGGVSGRALIELINGALADPVVAAKIAAIVQDRERHCPHRISARLAGNSVSD